MSPAKLLAQRRAFLVAESNLQRGTLRAQARSLGMISSDQGNGAAALLASVLAMIPGRAVTLLRTGLTLWQLWRSLNEQK